MINLLPPEMKDSYRYAARNVRLIRWVVIFGFSFFGLAAIVTAGLIYIHQSALVYAQQADTTQVSLSQQHIATTESQVKSISDNLKLAVQVLSQEVLFSKLITQLATITPNNVVLTNLTISKTVGSVDITALTTDYGAATQLQVNLADPANKIFTKADIISITCAPPTGAAPTPYPCTVSIRALFSTNNPFLFINDTGKKL